MHGETYEQFVDKFKPKLTTDDCYTPPIVYDAVKSWACIEYGIDPQRIVRPFYPGGDYENFDYPSDCVVLDNPPFSILSKICEFYLDQGIPFFLFAPSLKLFSRKVVMRMNHIICDADIEYENGAIMRTSFVTSFGGDTIAETQPHLTQLVKQAVDQVKSQKRVSLPKYEYPDNIVTSAMMQRYAKYGVYFSIKRRDCVPVSALDSQRASGKSIFGCGLLLSHKAAAEKAATEKAATEKAAAVKWVLSQRELNIIESLG